MAFQVAGSCFHGSFLCTRATDHSPLSCINGHGILQVSSSALKQYSPTSANLAMRGERSRGFCHPDLRNLKFRPFRLARQLRSYKPCRVKSEDSEGTLSSDGFTLDTEILERDLQIAIEEENYAKAAKIRDNLRNLNENSKASVLAANAKFYNAFRNGDLAAMQTLWTKGDNVCCVHPGAAGIPGHDSVIESWEYVLALYDFPLEIELRDVRVHVRGAVGYVTCLELVKTKGSSWGKQFATNVFERINGRWHISIHHASPIDL